MQRISADRGGLGRYGVFIVYPVGGRPPAQELVMTMNGFDRNFDEDNEVFAVNTIAFVYRNTPVELQLDETVRLYVVNILEFDETNSFHVHGDFFQEYRTGTSLEPDTFTDAVIFGQAERSILEVDFAELGWMTISCRPGS